MSDPFDDPKVPKYNISLTDDMQKDLLYCCGRLDLQKAEVFRRAIAHYRRSVERGEVK